MDVLKKLPGKIPEYLYILLYSFLIYPAVFKFSNLFFVDLRFQSLIATPGTSWTNTSTALGITLISVICGREAARRSGASLESCFTANFPLAGCGAMWFLAPTFTLLLLNIILVSISIGRTAALCGNLKLKEIKEKQALIILTAAIFLCAAIGAYHQCRSLDTLAMSWFDWGHFYECLNNFFRGKPFHLNLCGGSFLGSRFTPTLTLLLPVVATHSLTLFFFTGSLLVCSGAFFIYLIAKSLKMSVNEALMWSIWYLLIPGVANMNLSLREGFHEVFLLFPLVPAAVWCAINKKVFTTAILVLLILGVRETTGILAAGTGIILFVNKHKKTGTVLFLAGLLYVVITMKLLMPLFDPPVSGTYAHVGFYSHLGKNVFEIALSPLLNPSAFWSAFFNSHTIIFWCTLFLPFAVMAFRKPIWLLPVVPEFVMVSVDRRFDSQTILRHYQVSMLIFLIIATLYGAEKLRKNGKCRVLFSGLPSPDRYRGCTVLTLAATLLSFIFFVRYPGLPASDPQRRILNNGGITRLEDATAAVERIKGLIPRGSAVTAGAMIASALIPDYDIYFNFDQNEKTLQEYVVLENFSSFYFPEDRLSRYLLTSPNWQLLHQEFVDERSFQLFKRSEKPIIKKPPTVKIPDNVWLRTGQLIPLAAEDLELRAAQIAADKLRIGVRIKKKRANDAGFRTVLSFADGTELVHFTSFCNGRFPADLAEPGETFFYVVELPPNRRITSCKIDLVDLKSKTTPL